MGHKLFDADIMDVNLLSNIVPFFSSKKAEFCLAQDNKDLKYFNNLLFISLQISAFALYQPSFYKDFTISPYPYNLRILQSAS